MTTYRGSGSAGSGGLVSITADSVSITDTGLHYTATNVEDALAEIYLDFTGVYSSTQALTNKTINLASNTITGTMAEFDAACSDGNFSYSTHVHTASAVTNVPAGTIAATDVQAAINELDGDITNHLGDTTDAHDASAISVLDTGANFTATDVEGVLAELAGMTGLNYFTEARNTAAPNATVPVHSFTASGAETNIDATLSPKGSGALTARIADNTATGGNKRGTYAVDWQMLRSGASQVASGSLSSILGGSSNTAAGDLSIVVGGNNNSASSNSAAVVGGVSNTAGGNYSFVGGGSSNQSNGNYATIPGGYAATARNLHGRYSYASGNFSTVGDAQLGVHVQRLVTTDATASILTADGSATPSTTNVSVLPNNHAYTAVAYISARDTSTGDFASWKIEGAVKRGANAAATALVGTPAITTIAQEAGASTWAVAMVANTTRGSVEIQVTGEAATTIHWVCKLDTVEVG